LRIPNGIRFDLPRLTFDRDLSAVEVSEQPFGADRLSWRSGFCPAGRRAVPLPGLPAVG
jgi:hypothetical protein